MPRKSPPNTNLLLSLGQRAVWPTLCAKPHNLFLKLNLLTNYSKKQMKATNTGLYLFGGGDRQHVNDM